MDLPLRVDGDRRHRTIADAQRGKPSVTRLRVLARFHGYALVEAIPETGRTHQIRAHLAAVGSPVAADALYGGGLVLLSGIESGGSEVRSPILSRPALHAWSLTITHPITQQVCRFEAPYADDFAAALRLLRAG
jgi:23S rRNA-/tRNA-specific pseudouridylate synthase